MELIKNLISHNLIQTGTWLGVTVPNTPKVQQRLRVERVQPDQIWACAQYSGQMVSVPLDAIQEVDGMVLHRLCAQADLDTQGNKRTPQTRRGRKPKHMRDK